MPYLGTYFQKKDAYTIAYKNRHGKPCLIFLHGLSGSKEYFDSAFDYGFSKDYGILTLDIPGFGDSRVMDGDYNLKTQAVRISGLIRYLGIRDAYIIGHSFAGPISYLVYENLRRVIKGIVLVESSIYPAKRHSWTREITSETLDDYKNTFRDTCRGRYKFYEEGLVDKDKKNISILADGLISTSAEAMYYSSKSLIEYYEGADFAEKLSSSKVPVKYLQGSENIKGLAEDPGLIQIQERNFKIDIIDRSGHCMMIDNPGGFYKSIEDFITRGI